MNVRKALCLTLFAAAMAGSSGTARAEPKFLGLFWWPSHWERTTYKPYLESAERPQNAQWDSKAWEPADWAAQRRGGSAQLIEGFYKAGILSRQYVDDDLPVLEVGQNFYSLSGNDKRKVIATVDDYYKITSGHENGMFTLTDWRTRRPIGIYTANGLQLQ